jgi:glycosyltransferase involved in cell wall biosynthesis
MSIPLVTVCIPTYNGAAHVSECLDSVSSQTYPDFEILVVDDCSVDRTPDVVIEHQQRDPRVRLVRNAKTLGLTGNWNRCVELARGDYIKFCFQDDILYPECIEALMRAMSRGVRFAFCAREFIFETSTSSELRTTLERGRHLINALFANEQLIRPEVFCKSILAHMPGNIIGEPTVTLMHRDVLTAYGSFNPDFLQLLDLEMWCRIGAHESISYVPEVLARFRVHAGAESSRNRDRHLFRAQVVDAALLAHEFAFSPRFSGLRDIAKTLRPVVDLVDLFYEQAHWAMQLTAAGEAKRADSGVEDLRAVAARYPELLARPPLKYVVSRKLRSLKRLLGGETRSSNTAAARNFV